MSATTAAAVKAPDTFVILSAELSKAGYGYTQASKDAIENIAQRGIALTKEATTVTPDEVDFYRALRGKVTSTTDTIQAIESNCRAISLEKPVLALEENAPKMRAEFLSHNEKKRFEFLNSATFNTVQATASDTVKRLAPLAERTMRLLYTANGSRETPFKDQNSFIEHRNQIVGVYNKIVDFQNRIAALGNSLSADALYDTAASQRTSDTVRISRRAFIAAATAAIIGTAGYIAIVNHPVEVSGLS